MKEGVANIKENTVVGTQNYCRRKTVIQIKKHTRIMSVFLSVLMLCMVFTPIPAMAVSDENEGENYVDVVVPLSVAAVSPLTGSGGGKFNAFFNPNQTTATTNMAIFDWRDTSIPTNAVVTEVEVRSSRTNVVGMTYYVQVGKGDDVNNFDWAPNILWASTVTTDYFNDQDPNDYWALRFYATRVITGIDYGAGATVSSVTLRVYFE